MGFFSDLLGGAGDLLGGIGDAVGGLVGGIGDAAGSLLSNPAADLAALAAFATGDPLLMLQGDLGAGAGAAAGGSLFDIGTTELSGLAADAAASSGSLLGGGGLYGVTAGAGAGGGLLSSLGGLGNLAQIGSSLYGLSQGNQLRTAAAGADPFAPYRPMFAGQLAQLMANPSLVTKTPGYAANMQAAEQGLKRNLASQGLTGSGAAAEALTKFGGEYQQQAWQQQLQMLSGLSGANMNNAGVSLAGMASGYNTTNQSLNNLVKILPSIIGDGGGGGLGSIIGSIFGGP